MARFSYENIDGLRFFDIDGNEILDDDVDKAKSFGGNRSEAARYAAQMRWGNRTQTESAEFDPSTVPLRPVKESNQILSDLYPPDSIIKLVGKDTVEVVSEYQTHGSSLNRLLRDGNDRVHLALGLDRAMEKAVPLPTDMVFHRGIAVMSNPSKDQQKAMNFFQLLKVGQGFSDVGFSSTSTDIQVARDFGGRAGIRFEVTVRKGTKVLPVNSILRNMSIHKGEDEVILPRKAKFTVWSITDEPNTSRSSGGPKFTKVIKVVME